MRACYNGMVDAIYFSVHYAHVAEIHVYIHVLSPFFYVSVFRAYIVYDFIDL